MAAWRGGKGQEFLRHICVCPTAAAAALVLMTQASIGNSLDPATSALLGLKLMRVSILLTMLLVAVFLQLHVLYTQPISK